MSVEATFVIPNEDEFLEWLDYAVPIFVDRWLVDGRSLKVCGQISSDFSAVSIDRGFPVYVRHVPGHFVNVAVVAGGALRVDMSAAQFECDIASLRDFDPEERGSASYAKTKAVFDRIHRDPMSAISVSRTTAEDRHHGMAQAVAEAANNAAAVRKFRRAEKELSG